LLNKNHDAAEAPAKRDVFVANDREEKIDLKELLGVEEKKRVRHACGAIAVEKSCRNMKGHRFYNNIQRTQWLPQ
jgi:UDP-glucose 4-epimerase